MSLDSELAVYIGITTENEDSGWDGGVGGTESEIDEADDDAVDASDGAGSSEEDTDVERDAGACGREERRRRRLAPPCTVSPPRARFLSRGGDGDALRTQPPINSSHSHCPSFAGA